MGKNVKTIGELRSGQRFRYCDPEGNPVDLSKAYEENCAGKFADPREDFVCGRCTSCIGPYYPVVMKCAPRPEIPFPHPTIILTGYKAGWIQDSKPDTQVLVLKSGKVVFPETFGEFFDSENNSTPEEPY